MLLRTFSPECGDEKATSAAGLEGYGCPLGMGQLDRKAPDRAEGVGVRGRTTSAELFRGKKGQQGHQGRVMFSNGVRCVS